MIMIKYFLVLMLSLLSTVIFAEETDKGPANDPGSAAYCENYKDGSCRDPKGDKAACCVTNTIGGVANGAKLTDSTSGDTVTGSGSAADKSPAVDTAPSGPQQK
jgi:hypothetical protein